MQNNINELKQLFYKIKNKNFNKSLRTGSTSIGYTFETLINKKECNSFLPDYKGIEIKTKLGYSISPITLFTLTPRMNNTESAINYIYNNYSYTKNNIKRLVANIYCDYNNIICNKYIFKLKVDKINNKVNLIILDLNLNILNNNIYWNFETLKDRLYTKLKYLAVIKGYDYKINNVKYYKYTNLYIYKLKDFNKFIELLEKDLIYVTINISTFNKNYRKGEIHDRGTAFKIKMNCIDELFDLIEKI